MVSSNLIELAKLKKGMLYCGGNELEMHCILEVALS